MNHNKALIIVDAQRCFMPSAEGERLGVEGFGELPVPNGQDIVCPANMLTAVALALGKPVMTTQDQHPLETAHFSDSPNYIDTWPVHAVASTPGGMLHPELIAGIDSRVAHFIKGYVGAKTPAEDNSYSGALAHRTNPETSKEELLADYLKRLNILNAYILGLTVGKEKPLCVDSTALDLKKEGFHVILVSDAIEAVVPEDKEDILKNLVKQGIRLTTTKGAIADFYSTPVEVIR